MFVSWCWADYGGLWQNFYFKAKTTPKWKAVQKTHYQKAVATQWEKRLKMGQVSVGIFETASTSTASVSDDPNLQDSPLSNPKCKWSRELHHFVSNIKYQLTFKSSHYISCVPFQSKLCLPELWQIFTLGHCLFSPFLLPLLFVTVVCLYISCAAFCSGIWCSLPSREMLYISDDNDGYY